MEKEKDCQCGCNHEHAHDHECCHDHEEGFDTIVLTLDDDSEMECIILGTFDYKEKSYIALLPSNEEDDEEVFIYEFEELDEGEVDLKVIEDDSLFDEVSKKFEDLFLEEE